MFEAILQTKWPTLLGDKEAKGVTKGTTFSAYRNKEAPHVSTVVWQFPDMSTQKTIEALIEKHIRKIYPDFIAKNNDIHRRSNGVISGLTDFLSNIFKYSLEAKINSYLCLTGGKNAQSSAVQTEIHVHICFSRFKMVMWSVS